MFAAARPRNIDLRPHREDGYRTACRTQRGIYQVERFFALLTDQHLRRAYFCKPVYRLETELRRWADRTRTQKCRRKSF
jgi:hypothetical protein